MLQVGLTGGIGSGKSTVASIFQVLGIPVSNADHEAKRLMNEDPGLRQRIIAAFGEQAYKEGRLNRPWLAAQVFPHPDKLTLLNSLVHPVTIAAGKQWMQAQHGHSPYAIREAAIIFESNSDRGLDFIIGVSAPEEIRIQRTINRDHSTREQVLQRMQNQMDEAEKMRRSTAVIINDDRHPLIPQILALHKELLRLGNASK